MDKAWTLGWRTLALLLAACGGDASDTSGPGLFGEGDEPGGVNPPVTTQCVALTQSLPDDYTPGADDSWPACRSDDGKFHAINPDIGSVARAKAFEEIAALLFGPDKDANKQDFLSARKVYDEDEGIGSRVVRRYDPHYKPKAGADCTKAADIDANPDYCAGPAKILPIVQAALKNGYEGRDPPWHAGRLEGALLWFFTISEYKETLSCSEEDIQDCDSSYGYFDGAGLGLGLGRYIRAVDADAYEEATLGALAVSCWRDVDQDLPAKNLTLRERARTQFDRPVIRGAIRIVLDRIRGLDAADAAVRSYDWGFITAYLGALQSQAFRASGADKLIAAARVASSPDDVDLEALQAALQRMIDCNG